MYVDEYGNLTSTPPDPSKKAKVNAEDINVSTPKGNPSNQSKYIKNGYLKFFNSEKRYGFIEEAKTRKNYYVHEDSLLDRVNERDQVVFEVGTGPKGPIAINVKLNKEE